MLVKYKVFFDIPVDNLFSAPVFVRHIKDNYQQPDTIIVSPDVGGLVRARVIANKINAELAIVDKRRPKPGVSEVMNIIGDVSNKNCIIVDDIVDSGGTLCNAAEALINKGAKSVSAYITHGVLSGSASQRIANSKLSSLVITDSINQEKSRNSVNNIKVISIAPLIGEAIRSISEERSVSSLFD